MVRKMGFSFFFILMGLALYGQQKANPPKDAYAQDMVFLVADQSPKPNGGLCAFFEYTEDNIRKSDEAKVKGVKGNVFVQFVVEKDGTLSNIKVIKGIGYGCDEAVIKVLEKAPRWTPGIQKGKPVRVQHTMAILVR